MLSLNRPSSPLTNHTRSPQSSRPASPTLPAQDEASVHSMEPSTHAPPLNAVRQVNLGLARVTSSGSGRGKRGSAISGRKSTSLRRKEIPSQAEESTEAHVPAKAETPKTALSLGPQVSTAVNTIVAEPSTKEDPAVVEASTSAPAVSEEAAPRADRMEPESTTVVQPASPEKTDTSRDLARIEQELSFGTAEAESSVPDEELSAQEDQPSQVPPTGSSVQQTKPESKATSPPVQTEKPVISYAAVAAAPAETSKHEPEPSKLGLDLHGESTPVETQSSAVEPSEPIQNDGSEPSFADVASRAVTSEEAAPPITSTPTEADVDADEVATPPNESVDNEDEASPAGEQNVGMGDASAGKGKGKGKGKKGKKGKPKGKGKK